MNIFQVILILNFYTTQIIFDESNKDLIKLVRSIGGWKIDHNRQKTYIPSSKTHYFTNMLSINGVKWARLSNENYTNTKLTDFVNREQVYQENKFDISLNDMIHKGYIKSDEELDHIKRENTIRIRYQSKHSVLVDLPMSLYSFHIINKLKKTYSLDGFAWIFVGKVKIQKLLETCRENKIQIIEERCNSYNGDRFLIN